MFEWKVTMDPGCTRDRVLSQARGGDPRPFHADQSFREMCGDYAETLDALERWEASSGPQTTARIEEYRELARALETEVASALGLPPRDTKDDLSDQS